MSAPLDFDALPLPPWRIRVLRHSRDALRDLASPVIAKPAGTGSGKTRGLIDWVLHRGWLNSPIPSMLVEPTYAMVTDILVRSMEEYFEEHKVRHRWIGPGNGRRSSTMTIFPGGSVPEFDILLRSADRPKRLDGGNLGAVGVDEAGQCSADAIDRARRRARHPLARCCQFYLTGTPEGFGAFWEWCEGKPQAGTNLIRARTQDNIFLPSNYVETTLSHLDDDDREQYVEGRFIAKGGRVYKAFRRETHCRRCARPFEGKLFVACDFNVGKMHWIFGVIVGARVHVWGEIVGRDTNTFEQTEEAERYLQRKLSQHGIARSVRDVIRETRVYADPSGGARKTSAPESDLAIMRRAGFRVVDFGGAPSIEDSVAAVQDRMRTVDDENVPMFLVDHDGAPELVKSFEQLGYDASGKVDKGTKEALDAGSDCARYLVWAHPEWHVTLPRGNVRQWA